jgi:putative FmdB family regulatory protein
MPFYEYKCSQCQKVHEILQFSGESDLAECPDCKGKVERLVSLSSFALKGTGWYSTDYKKTPAPKSGSNLAATSASPSQTPAAGGGCGSGACGKGHNH